MAEIVVGVDGSEVAAASLRWAAREAALRDATLTAVLAWGHLDVRHRPVEPENQLRDEDDAHHALDHYVADALGSAAAKAVGRQPVQAYPATALLDAARHASLLVVGARGRGGFPGLDLGSVSQHCIHHATCPVAVVRDTAHVAPESAEPERVVAGVDGSPESLRALEWAIEEAQARHARLDVVHAWQPPYVTGFPYSGAPHDRHASERRGACVLREAVAQTSTAALGDRVSSALVEGGATAAILDAAKGADLIVVGARGAGGLQRWLLGSVSSQITRHAPCPVVVTPRV